MHENIQRIVRRASRILLDAYHNGHGDRDQVQQAWAKFNLGSPIHKRTWPGAPLPADLDGEETSAAARLVATAMQLRMLGMTDIQDGIAPGPKDLVLLRGIDHNDPLISQVREAAGGAGFTIDATVENEAALSAQPPRAKRGMSSQASLF